VVIFRCTKKLLTRLNEPVRTVAERSTTALGDWYLTLLVARPQWLLIGVSETSRLPLVLPAKNLARLHVQFSEALERLLDALGAPAAAIEAERMAMRSCAFAPTANRSVLGSLNEFTQHVRWALEDRLDKAPHELSLWLAETPILPLHDFPDRMALRALEKRATH
jgi:hypothetical protein